jgi:hypothetical protein
MICFPLKTAKDAGMKFASFLKIAGLEAVIS